MNVIQTVTTMKYRIRFPAPRYLANLHRAIYGEIAKYDHVKTSHAKPNAKAAHIRKLYKYSDQVQGVK